MITQGFVAPGFERVAEAFSANFEEDLELGASFAAVIEGECVVELWGGYANREKTTLWAEDTIVPVYSVTKGVAALVIARLVGEGKLDYDAPVAAIWPEFAANGKEAITLGQMLSHQAGLCGFKDPVEDALWFDPPALAARLAEQAPLWPPRTASGYHPMTWGYLAGEIVRRADGRSLGTVLREEICGPLAIDFQIGVGEADDDRVGDMTRPKQAPDLGELTEPRRIAFMTKWAGPDRSSPAWRRVEIPSANGHGTALSVALLYSAYAEGGQVESDEIMTPAAFDGLTKVRSDGPDLVLPFHMRFGAGNFRNVNSYFGLNPDAIGHSGWGGACGFGDPARRLSAGYVMNRQAHHLIGDPRSVRVIEALYASL
jgi:CubicO group peptidase (beta-lactamase class C family)